MNETGYRRGGHWLIDDRTGERIRASDARQEWTGAVVHRDEWEPRHPQDFVRGRADRQVPKGPLRPEPVAVIIGPLRTRVAAAAAAGATSVAIESSVRMENGDAVTIMLDNSETFRTVLLNVPDTSTIVLLQPLPGAVSAGNEVINETAVAPADIG